MTARRKVSKPLPVFVDTGYLRAMVDTKDDWHAVALRWTEALSHPYRLTTTSVLCECSDYFAKRGAWDRFNVILARMEKDPFVEIVPVDRPFFDRAVALRRKSLSRWWGLTDCLSFVLMKERKVTEALSTDGDFNEAGFDALLLRV